MDMIKRMVIEVTEPSVKKKYAKKGENDNAVVTKSVNTTLVSKYVEVANPSLKKGKDVIILLR